MKPTTPALVLLASCVAVSAAHAQESVPRALTGHYELVPQVLPGLRAQDDAVRARCAFLLGQVGDRASAAAIAPLLKDSSRAVRYQAGIALCALGDPAGVPAAGAALASAAEWIRHYAVHALAGLATDEARAVLEAQHGHQGDLVRGQIDDAMGMWPWPSAPPAPAKEEIEPSESLHDLFIDAGGELVIESDGYWHQGDYLQCVRCNQAAIFLDPQYVDLYGTSAWLLWSIGLNDRATAILRQGLGANPQDWNMWFDAGYHYFTTHDYGIAARLLGRAVELGAPALQSRQYCHALEKSGRPDRALEEWLELQRKSPDDPVVANHINRLRKLLAGEQAPTVEA